MVAAATTSLPERADTGRDYDYRYAWIRDQCFAGQAALAVGARELLDAAVGFVTRRVLEDQHGCARSTGWTVARSPDSAVSTSPATRADRRWSATTPGRNSSSTPSVRRSSCWPRPRVPGVWTTRRRALEMLVRVVEECAGQPGAGIWELEDRHWAHSRLICVAGLRPSCLPSSDRVAAATLARVGEARRPARHDVDRDCLHPSGRWQRSPDDPRSMPPSSFPASAAPCAPPDRRTNARSPPYEKTSVTTATSTGSGSDETALARRRGSVRAQRLPHVAGPTPTRPRGRGAPMVRAQPRSAGTAGSVHRGVRRRPTPAPGQRAPGIRACGRPRDGPASSLPPAWSRAASKPKPMTHSQEVSCNSEDPPHRYPTVVVTGASGGIGRASPRVRETGASVALLARGQRGWTPRPLRSKGRRERA